MFKKFRFLLVCFGEITAYLFMAAMDNRLSHDDVILAQNTSEDSTVIRVVAGDLDGDMEFLAREVLRAAAYDGSWEYIPEEV